MNNANNFISYKESVLQQTVQDIENDAGNFKQISFGRRIALAKVAFLELLDDKHKYRQDFPQGYTICTELKRIAPFDMERYPDAYVEVINQIFSTMAPVIEYDNFGKVKQHFSSSTSMNDQDKALILLNAIDEQILTEDQAAKMVFYYMTGRDNGNYEYSTDDVIAFCDKNVLNYGLYNLFDLVSRNCSFQDLNTMKKFLINVRAQTCRYAQVNVNYDGLLDLYRDKLVDADFLVIWLGNKRNFYQLTADQIEHILKLIVEEHENFFTINRLDELSYVLAPMRMLELFKTMKSFVGITETILSVGMSKTAGLAVIQDILQHTKNRRSYATPDNLNLWKLDLNKDEILAFIEANPEWADEMDVWVSKQNLTDQELAELFERRIKVGSLGYSTELLKFYKIKEQDSNTVIPKLLSNGILPDEKLINTLSWQSYYNMIKQYSKSKLLEVIYRHAIEAPHEHMDQFVAEYVATIDIASANKLASTHFKTPCMYAILGAIVDRFIPEDVHANQRINQQMKIWLKTFILRLSQEVHVDKIQELFSLNDDDDGDVAKFIANNNQRKLLFNNKLKEIANVFKMNNLELNSHLANEHIANARAYIILTMEQIMGLAVPDVRMALIDNIITLVNDDDRLQIFSSILANNVSKRHYIPTLIAVGSANLGKRSKHLERLLSIIMLIDNNYDDSGNMHSLLNAWMPLFASTTISYVCKCDIAEKALRYDIVIESFTDQEKLLAKYNGRRSTIEFTQMYIYVLYKDHIGLQAYTTHGELLEILDIAQVPFLQDLHKFLTNFLAKNNAAKLGSKQIPEITSKIAKTKIFPCGINAHKQALGMITGVSILQGLDILQNEQFKRSAWLHDLGYAIKRAFAVSDENFDRIMTYLTASRNPIAIIAYYALLSQSPKNGQYVQLIRDFVRMLVSKDCAEYHEYRYAYSEQPQLAAVVGKNARLLAEWRRGLQLDFNTLLDRMTPYFDLYDSNNNFNVVTYISRQMLHHLPADKFTYVYQCLHNPLQIESILEQLTVRMQADDIVQSHYDPRYTLLKVQFELIELLHEADVQDKQEYIDKLSTIRDYLYHCHDAECMDFVMDIDFVLSHLCLIGPDDVTLTTKKHVVTDKWIIVDTDNPEDMFLMGTEVENSCQHIDRSETNHSLIGGYVLSGYIRQIAIKDQSGKIVARAVLRLMRDTVTAQPVLFLEGVYPESCTKQQLMAIELFACLRALQLDCALVRADSELSVVNYPNKMEVVAVKLSEYVDALSSACKSGYEIGQAELVFDPKQYRVAVQQLVANKKGILSCESSPLYQTAFKQSLALRSPQAGPRPLSDIADLKFMFSNYRRKTGGTANDFWQQIVGMNPQNAQQLSKQKNKAS